MKTHIVGLVVLAVVALAILVYVEQTGAHNARLQMAGLVADNTQSNLVGPEPDVDTASDLAAADYPIDVANSIPVPASTSPELRRGVANEIVLAGVPTAPRARPAQPRGIAVPRHAADLTGRQIVPVPAQEDLMY
jgi:hypothetical protein